MIDIYIDTIDPFKLPSKKEKWIWSKEEKWEEERRDYINICMRIFLVYMVLRWIRVVIRISMV
jgi:hypothetical protein